MEHHSPRRAILRWLRWTAVVLGVALFMASNWAFYDAKFHRATGNAEWIWTWNWISRQKPEVFFASRNFRLDSTAPYVRVRIACDPMYTLFFNEVEVGGDRWERSGSLDVYDVTDLAVVGTNRMVIAVRAPDGVGGLLVALETAPSRRNIIVSDETWRMTGTWSPSLLLRDGPGAVAPRLLGQPPWGKWNFPRSIEHDRYEPGGYVLHPVDRTERPVALRQISVVGGVAIAAREDVVANVWDFGDVSGRPRLEVGAGDKRVVRFVTVSNLEDLQAGIEPEALVVAPGEERVTDPSSRSFRYFVAFDPIEEVSVLSDRP